MKSYSNNVVTPEAVEKLADDLYTMKGMIFASFVVNIVLSVTLFVVLHH